MKVKVAIIDTEVHSHKLLKNLKINTLWKNSAPQLWHGTAICGEIYQECQNIEIDVYPVFNDINIEAHNINFVFQLTKFNCSSCCRCSCPVANK